MSESFQRRFHRRWQHLTDPHVRALAWLLDAPGLLDADALQWRGQVARLPDPMENGIADWLRELDRQPQALHAALDLQPLTRLGRYAEKLMAFYFRHCGTLAAQGVQVQSEGNGTIGEFDFLLRDARDGDVLLHWELATKFYLLEPGGIGQAADYFVGPNLADTLGAKMRKIFEQQLALGRHPAAAAFLPQAVARAQALVKGWLFYHDEADVAPVSGIAGDHCRGFWCALSELAQREGEMALVLPRLSWLAPARAASADVLDRPDLEKILQEHFTRQRGPVLIAFMEKCGDAAVEVERGFIVPDDWRERAGERLRRPGLLD